MLILFGLPILVHLQVRTSRPVGSGGAISVTACDCDLFCRRLLLPYITLLFAEDYKHELRTQKVGVL